MTFRQKYFDWAIDKFNMRGYEREQLKKVYNKVSPIVWVILKFMAYLWLINRVHMRMGYEKTMVFLMVI